METTTNTYKVYNKEEYTALYYNENGHFYVCKRGPWDIPKFFAAYDGGNGDMIVLAEWHKREE